MWPPTLSVIFGTWNRLHLLQECIPAVRESAGTVPLEIVVCHGPCTDGTEDWLLTQANRFDDVVVVAQPALLGGVSAFNAAYRASSGKYICNLNDDCKPMGSALADAVAALDEDKEIGQAAFTLNRGGRWYVQPIHDKVYANFGVIRREVAERMIWVTGGYWAPVYFTYGADTEVSCWVHRLGYRVEPLPARVQDRPAFDQLRDKNYADNRHMTDNKTFWGRWPDAAMLEPKGPLPNLTQPERFRLERLEA